MTKGFTATLALAVSLGVGMPAAKAADDGNVRLVGSNGLQFLLNYVVVEQKLIEKHATALGIADPKVTFTIVSNGAAINDSLISDSADVGGVPGPSLLLFWEKTKGAQAIRAIVPLAEIPPTLVTTDPRIKTLADYTDKDRIAMATVKRSSYSIFLQMAAVKEFGWDQRLKFDPLSVQLSAPDTMTALLSGATEIKSTVVPAPFNAQLIESGKAHQVISLDDVLGDHGTLTVLSASERFHSGKPKTYQAVKEAFEEGVDFINKNPHDAAVIYMKYEPQKQGADWVQQVISNPKLARYTKDPHRFGKLGDFMKQMGMIKDEPASWTDLFFDKGEGLNGD